MVIEKNVFSSVDSFDTALEMAFGAFYIFNLEYPKNCCITLEMIQQYLLKIHPDQDSRSKKQRRKKCKEEKSYWFNDKTFLKQYMLSLIHILIHVLHLYALCIYLLVHVFVIQTRNLSLRNLCYIVMLIQKKVYVVKFKKRRNIYLLFISNFDTDFYV